MIRRFTGLVLASCLAAASACAANYLPLETGNSWTYRNHATGAAFTVRVSLPAVVNGNIYYTLQGYVNTNLLVRVDDHDTLVYLDPDTNADRPLVSFAPFAGGWLRAPYRACEQESQTQDKRGTYDGPAGEFQNVLEIRFRTLSCADAGTEVEQFAENIGMLRRVDQSIAGPRQFDLVYARVGSMIINGLPNGSFSATVEQLNGSDQATVVLRLRLNGTGPSKITFPSGQEYEVVLKDEAGNAVWTWSRGKFFDQARHEKTVSTEWTASVAMPRPGGAGGEPASKNYTVHAWLTTEGPAPEYAATVPLIINTSEAHAVMNRHR